MALTVNPTLPVSAPAPIAATSGLVLQPGTVVTAQVQNLLADNLVRIAIANLSLDVLTEVPLQAGQTLQLAVSQTADTIKLTLVGQSGGAAADSVSLSPNAPVASLSAVVQAPVNDPLTPLERIAVSIAAQGAATQQGSLAPLFADLGAAAASNSLPPALQQAVQQVLAQQTPLDQNLTGPDIKTAFQSSGLFLEASLAAGSPAPTAAVPDLKAALIVLRLTLTSALGSAEPVASAQGAVAALPAPAAATGQPAPVAAAALVQPQAAAVPSSSAPPLVPAAELAEALQPSASAPRPTNAAGDAARIVLTEALSNVPRGAAQGAVLTLLQEALQEIPRANTNGAVAAKVAPQNGASEQIAVRTPVPPPPFRGSLPSPQPIAQPSIAPNAPLTATAHRLLENTDAAIARQTLLQVASLPDRVDTQSARLDQAGPRWNFEIPFATAQGTAMAQFEISRDGGGNEAEASSRVWRARFTLNVEPAGPIHALISLSGERTSVRMWAERPATAAELKAGASELSQALSKAELVPGDIIIREGTPPQPAPAKAGHFLDRAL